MAAVVVGDVSVGREHAPHGVPDERLVVDEQDDRHGSMVPIICAGMADDSIGPISVTLLSVGFTRCSVPSGTLSLFRNWQGGRVSGPIPDHLGLKHHSSKG